MFSLLLQGCRAWKHTKGIGLLAVAALALGIGSTTAIYTVVQAVLLNPLPFANPDRYLAVQGTWRGIPESRSAWSYPNCVDFAQRARTLDAFGCIAYRSYNIVLGGQAIHTAGIEVSPALINSLGINLRLGGWFRSQPDPQQLDPHRAVISEQLWRLAGSDPKIVGKTLILNSVAYRITGVTPAWLHFPLGDARVGVWVPMNPSPGERSSRGDKYMLAFAKRKSGVTLAQVASDMSRIAAQLEREVPDEEKNHTVAVESLLSDAVGRVRPSLLVLLAAAAALLLIACGNVASLFLARAVARARETAVRVAIGGSVLQLGAQYFSEGMVVAIGAAVLGTAISVVMVKSVLSLAADVLPRADQIGVDWGALGVTLATAIFCGVLFSLAPLWQALRTPPNAVLTSGVRASASAGSRRLLRILVIGEIALSFGLLAVAGLFLAQMHVLFGTDPGFDPRGLVTFSILAPAERFSTAASRIAIQDRLLTGIRKIPGVRDAAFTSVLPFSGDENDVFAVPDHRKVEGLAIDQLAKLYDYEVRFISDDFFSAMRIRVRSGEGLDRIDAKALPVVVSDTVARTLWPRQDALGHILNVGDQPEDLRVTGVVADVRDRFDKPSRGHIYVSYKMWWMRNAPMKWVVRSDLATSALLPQIRRVVAGVDPQESVFDAQPMSALLADSLGRERLQSFVVSFFGAAALLLSILGIYGVVSYSVRQRTPEMGIRLALGATGNSLIGLVLSEAVLTAGIGIAIGLALVVAAQRLFASLGVPLTDVRPYLVAVALVALSTLLASFTPALAAGMVSPTIVLGNEAENISRRLRHGYWRVARTVSALVGSGRGEGRAMEMAILSEVTESTRDASSFNEAISAALSVVVAKTGAAGATLLVRRSPDQPFRCLSSVPESNEHWTLPPETLLLNRLQHFYPGLPITQGDLAAFERWAQESSLTGRLAEIATLRSIGAAAAVPVSVKDEIAGILFVNPGSGKPAFDGREIRLLRSVAAQLALMIENSRLTDRIVEQERLKRDLALATEVQQRLFPEHAPEIKTARLAGFCLPARGVGGDLYDFLRLDEQQIGIAIADVAGKGIAAALVTSIIQASIRSLAGTDGDSPASLANKINRLLCASTGPSSYATFFYAKFDEAARRLSYVNGGHNPPFLLRNGGSRQIEELAAGGMIIGMFPFASYQETQVDLHPGDVLMAFTDGVSEAHNPAEEEFGEDRIKELLRSYAHLPVEEMSVAIFDRLKLWMQDAPQHDDLTFVLMKVH